MNRLQGVLIAVALACFAAGIGVGLAVPVVASMFDEQVDYDERYVKRLADWCDLRSDQISDLRAILFDYNETVRAISDDDREEWVLQGELVKAQKLMDQRIYWILDTDQRNRWDAGN